MSKARTFLVIADGSDESRTAAFFAARRAKKTGGAVAALAVVEPSSFEHWIGVGETMRQEAEEAAETMLNSLAEDIESVTEARPRLILKEGELIDVLRAVVDGDESIAILVIGAAVGGEGPGPLVTALARAKGLFGERAIPVTVVPGDLSRDEIKALA
ncbi:universal stress protein [Marinicauda salina]|jgi:nucleotide-binding universal stress UspA family protein|uniref:Universal stress protein n=1 Tax=Marinicauda salina TaxID=2135793 RepID=A0A2U2BWI8_9PROT|nr:universal stress protein [Marinicauda salina]PWE18334.1 universal stress protein [Marinicauda salina]